eukprot:Colp12_sorted_trinity150504_noHs@36555
MRMKYYLEYCENQDDDAPLYIFDSAFADDKIKKEIASDYALPKYFTDDLFKLVGLCLQIFLAQSALRLNVAMPCRRGEKATLPLVCIGTCSFRHWHPHRPPWHKCVEHVSSWPQTVFGKHR